MIESVKVESTVEKMEQSSHCPFPHSLFEDYEQLLNSEYIPFKKKGSFLNVANNDVSCGWVLYLSIIRPQMHVLLERLLPFLKNSEISFSLPNNSITHTVILEGGFGQSNVGKIITVYPPDISTAISIAKKLIHITESIKGPYIPSAYPLSNCVYAEKITNKVFKQLNQGKRMLRSEWPFGEISPITREKKAKFLNGCYLQIEIIKNDIKGRVFKALRFSKWAKFDWCVIKEGINHQCTDDNFRSIKERLKWQFEVHQFLEGKIAIPKCYEYFEENNNAYLSMDFIDGISINDIIGRLRHGNIWSDIEVTVRVKVLDYLIQCINIIGGLHSCGLVHRDINPGNFLIDEADKVYAIDLELCYNLDLQEPNPPFTYGTAGYISPEQANLEIPAYSDDIYSLGALMVKLFTGLSPAKITVENPEDLINTLMFHIGNFQIAVMISQCLSVPTNRPCLPSIKHSLEVYSAVLLTKKRERYSHSVDLFIDRLIDGSLKGITFNYASITGNLWTSKNREINPDAINEIKDFSWKPGFYDGVSGMLYVLSIAEQLGYTCGNGHQVVSENIDAFQMFYQTAQLTSGPGLYNGSYGYAVTVNAMISAGLLPEDLKTCDAIYKSLKVRTTYLNLSAGLAGQGLSMLYLYGKPKFPSLYADLQTIAKLLLDLQNKDGSWNIEKPGQHNSNLKLTGFSDGIAGIIYFLIELYKKFECRLIKDAVNRALGYLLKSRINSGGNLVWALNNKNKLTDPWLDCGFSGVGFIFLKAYQVFNVTEYKEVAINILNIHPKHISSNFLSLGSGISGLGEIYLDAYEILKDDEWKKRADHIASFLNSIKRERKNESLYWLDGNETLPSFDLVNGNAGIAHFLLKYAHPDKVIFPFIIT